MRSACRPLALLLLGLFAAGLSGCSLISSPTPTPTPQRRAASAAPKPASSPVILNGASSKPANAAAAPESQLKVPSLRLPTDGMQVVLVDSTEGQGVWLRRQPAGEPLRVWPEGSPMLVVGEDRFVEGRTWRHVQTLDGETGWAAADFLFPTDPSALALAANSLSELAGGRRDGENARPPESQSRTVAAEATPAAPPAGRATATSPTVARAATKPGPASVAQSAPQPAAAPSVVAAAAPATPAPTATPLPSATPIRAPAGATSIAAGQTTMAVAGSARGLPIQVGNRPRAGMELMSVQVKIANRDTAPFALYRSAFRLALSDRTRVEPLAGGDSPIPYSAAIEPGSELEGSLTFEVPVGTRVDGLIWAPDRDVAYSLGI